MKRVLNHRRAAAEHSAGRSGWRPAPMAEEEKRWAKREKKKDVGRVHENVVCGR